MRKKRTSYEAVVNYVALNNIDTMKKLFYSEIGFIREIESAVSGADVELREKVLLVCFDEAKRLQDLLKMSEQEEKRIRAKEEYIDPETFKLILPA